MITSEVEVYVIYIRLYRLLTNCEIIFDDEHQCWWKTSRSAESTMFWYGSGLSSKKWCNWSKRGEPASEWDKGRRKKEMATRLMKMRLISVGSNRHWYFLNQMMHSLSPRTTRNRRNSENHSNSTAYEMLIKRFHDYLNQFCEKSASPYLDDIFIESSPIEQNSRSVKNGYNRLQDFGLGINPVKCEFDARIYSGVRFQLERKNKCNSSRWQNCTDIDRFIAGMYYSSSRKH